MSFKQKRRNGSRLPETRVGNGPIPNQPMLEVLKLLRANGYKTSIVTGGGQDFVRIYSEQVYGIPPEQVVGTAGGTKFGFDKEGRPELTKEPDLLLNDDFAGKPEGIHLVIGRRPHAAFGNSTGDQQMLEYTTIGNSTGLGMLVLHDDATREYAYGPPWDCPAPRSADSRSRFTMKPKNAVGSSSA